MPKTKREIAREVDAILLSSSPKTRRHAQDIQSREQSPWGSVPVPDRPPRFGTTVEVDGRSYALVPARIDTAHAQYERWIARPAKRNEDDAWFVVSPRGDILAVIVGVGKSWSIWRRSGGLPWRKGEDAEIYYYRGIEDDWRSVVTAIAKFAV